MKRREKRRERREERISSSFFPWCGGACYVSLVNNHLGNNCQ